MAWACWRASKGADVIHANWAICGAVAALIGRLRGIPVVTTLRGADVGDALPTGLHRLILVVALRGGTAVVTVSAAFLRRITAGFPAIAGRLSCIPNGVDEAFLAVGRERHLAAPVACLRLVAVGSLIRRKGVDLVLRALARSLRRDQVRLAVVGEGPERAALEALARDLDLTDQVEFYGWVVPQSMPRLLAQSDALVLASHSEGRPNVVLEAMAAALAVVATAIDGVAEMIRPGETGLLFADGDIGQLAGHIDALAADPALVRQLGSAARAEVCDAGLTWDVTVSGYLDLFRRLSLR